ncbi:MAG: sulfatase-like hydrolase/transferase [Planctomycetota bacterium]
MKQAGVTAGAVVAGGYAPWSTPAVAARAAAEGPGQKPNLLFVFSDQQTYDMLGCNGNPEVHTPHADRFAEQGIRFTHCFSNAPVCTPYRGMLMSGKHPLRNGAFENDLPLCPAAGPHFGEVLESAGYRTGYVGKWHLLGGDRKRPVPHGPLRAGFEDTFLTDNCTTEFRAGHSFYYDDQGKKQIFDSWQPYGQTDQAEAFLDEAAAGDHPFALFVSWHPPHDHGRRPAPPDPHYDYRHYPDELAEHYPEDQHLTLRPGVEDMPERQEQLRDYYAMCTGIDVAFGRLLDKLESLGLDDNTIVVFTSDHGDMLGSFDAPRPKRPPHDTSSHVPMLIRQPGVLPAGQTSGLLFGALDIMPTLLGLMGLDGPADMDGQDLSVPIRTGDEDAVESIPMLMISWPVFRGVITKDWTFGMGRPGEENDFNSVLFDRRNDPHQQSNLYADPAYKAVHAELKQLTQRWMDRFEDPFITIPEMARIQPWESWREPPGDPRKWPLPVDVINGRSEPLVPIAAGAGAAVTSTPKKVNGWAAMKQTEFELREDELVVRLTGSDPIMIVDKINVRGGRVAAAVRMRSNTGGKAQWFWSTGGAFSAGNAQWMRVREQPGVFEYRTDLNAKGKLTSLRFDPAQGPGEVGIEWIELQDAFGRTLQRWDFGTKHGK